MEKVDHIITTFTKKAHGTPTSRQIRIASATLRWCALRLMVQCEIETNLQFLLFEPQQNDHMRSLLKGRLQNCEFLFEPIQTQNEDLNFRKNNPEF